MNTCQYERPSCASQPSPASSTGAIAVVKQGCVGKVATVELKASQQQFFVPPTLNPPFIVFSVVLKRTFAPWAHEFRAGWRFCWDATGWARAETFAALGMGQPKIPQNPESSPFLSMSTPPPPPPGVCTEVHGAREVIEVLGWTACCRAACVWPRPRLLQAGLRGRRGCQPGLFWGLWFQVGFP